MADLTASVRARLLNRAKAQGEEFERTLARYACERLLYRLGASSARNRSLPAVLTAAFYRLPELETRWRAYLAAGTILTPPPSRFPEIGERIAGFLAPVRSALLGADAFDRHWPAGGPWQAAVAEGRDG